MKIKKNPIEMIILNLIKDNNNNFYLIKKLRNLMLFNKNINSYKNNNKKYKIKNYI